MQSVLSPFPGPPSLPVQGVDAVASDQGAVGGDFGALLKAPAVSDSGPVQPATDPVAEAVRDPGFAALWSLPPGLDAIPRLEIPLAPVLDGSVVGFPPVGSADDQLAEARPDGLPADWAFGALPVAILPALTATPGRTSAPASLGLMAGSESVLPSDADAKTVGPQGAPPNAALGPTASSPVTTSSDAPAPPAVADSVTAVDAPAASPSPGAAPQAASDPAAAGERRTAGKAIGQVPAAPGNAPDTKLPAGLGVPISGNPKLAAIQTPADPVAPQSPDPRGGLTDLPVADSSRLTASLAAQPAETVPTASLSAPEPLGKRSMVVDAAAGLVKTADSLADEQQSPPAEANDLAVPEGETALRQRPVSLWEAAFPAMPARVARVGAGQGAGIGQAGSGLPALTTDAMTRTSHETRADLRVDDPATGPQSRPAATLAVLTAGPALQASGPVMPNAVLGLPELMSDLPPDEALAGLGAVSGPFGPHAQTTVAQLLPTSPALPPMVAQIVGGLSSAKPGVTEIALSPEELGRVTLQMQADAQDPDRMVVMLSFDRPETLELFRRHADQLAEVIRSAGYSGVDIGFAQGGSTGGENASGFAQGGGGDGPAHRPDLPLPVTPAPAARRADAGLYLRL